MTTHRFIQSTPAMSSSESDLEASIQEPLLHDSDSTPSTSLRTVFHTHYIAPLQSGYRLWQSQHHKHFTTFLLCLFHALLGRDYFQQIWTYQNLSNSYDKLKPSVNTTTGTAQQVPPISQTSYRPVLKVRARNPETGRTVITRALLDTGTHHSTINESLVDRLALTRQLQWPYLVECFPGTGYCVNSEVVQLELEAIGSGYRTRPITMSITNESDWQIAQAKCLVDLVRRQLGIELTDEADDQEDLELEYDILLGQNCLQADILTELGFADWIQFDEELALLRTRLGWTTLGCFDIDKYRKPIKSFSKVPELPSTSLLMPLKENTEVDFDQLSVKRESMESLYRLIFALLMCGFPPHCLFFGAFFLVFVLVTLLFHFTRTTIRLICFRIGVSLQAKMPSFLKHLTTLALHLLLHYLDKLIDLYYLMRGRIQPTVLPAHHVPFRMSPLLRVRLRNPTSGQTVNVGVFLDTGANISVIDAELADSLGAQRLRNNGKREFVRVEISPVEGTGNDGSIEAKLTSEVELAVHLYPIRWSDRPASPVLANFVSNRYGVTFPTSDAAPERFARVILGCDVLAQAHVLFPSPHPPQEVFPSSNLWLFPTRLGWTWCGTSHHNWPHVLIHKENMNFEDF